MAEVRDSSVLRFTQKDFLIILAFARQVDHWLDFTSFRLSRSNEAAVDALQHLDTSLKMSTYLVGDAITIADYAVWSFLKGSLTNSTLTGVVEDIHQ